MKRLGHTKEANDHYTNFWSSAPSWPRSCVRNALGLPSAFALLLGLTPDVSLAYSCPKQPSPEPTETYHGFLGGVHELEGQQLPYRLFVPEDYNPNVAYPLVLYLHHAGLSGTDQNNDSGWDNCVQLTSEIGSGNDYGGAFIHRAVDEDGQPFNTQERYPHFLLAPHAEVSFYGFGGGTEGSATGPEHPTRPLLMGILDDVQAAFNIDPGRLYVTGVSMGCYGTWDLIMRNPGLFAAASPQSCRGDPDTNLLAELKDMPIWSLIGTNDSYFGGAQAMADGMEEIGATAFTFTAMQGVGHSINDRGYDYPGFMDWLFAQRRTDVDPPGTGGVSGDGGSPSSGGTGGEAATGGVSSGVGGVFTAAGGADTAAGGDGLATGGGFAGTGGAETGTGGNLAGTGGSTTGTGGSAQDPDAGPGCSVLPASKPHRPVAYLLLALTIITWRRKRTGASA